MEPAGGLVEELAAKIAVVPVQMVGVPLVEQVELEGLCSWDSSKWHCRGHSMIDDGRDHASVEFRIGLFRPL